MLTLKNNNENKTYSKVTHRLTFKFDNFIKHDHTNKTLTKRDVADYNQLLSDQMKCSTLTKTIKQLSKTLGRPLVILDAGCGEGVVLDEILSKNGLKEHVKRCVGISKHYFSGIAKVSEKHGKQFQFYLGCAQDILRKEPIKADLILDIWGALSYSKDRMGLIRQYYHVLNPHGQAYIYCNRKTLVKEPDESASHLFEILATQHSAQFASNKFSKLLCITRTSERLSSPNLELTSAIMEPSVMWSEPKGEQQRIDKLASLQKGNALAPVVTYSRAPHATRILRMKPF